MKKMRMLGVVLLAAILALGGLSSVSAAGELYVSPTGTDTGACSIALPCATVTYAISQAVAGDTIHMTAGVFTENVTISKFVKIIGAGSGSASATNTVWRKSGGGAIITLAASGTAAANPLLLQNLRLEPVGVFGLHVPSGTVNFVKLENVFVIGSSPVNDTEGEVGLWVGPTASLTNLEVSHSAFDKLIYGWYLQKEVSADASTVRYVTVIDTTFNSNMAKGVYAEKLADAVFARVTVDANGQNQGYWNSAFNAGIDTNLKAGTYQNLTFSDMVITNNAKGVKEGAGLMIKARDDASSYNTFPATLNNVVVVGSVITGNERGIRFGEPGKINAGPTNASVHGSNISGNAPTYTGVDGSAYGGIINMSNAGVDAENNWFGCAAGPGQPGCDAVAPTVGAIDAAPWRAALGDVYVDAAGSDVTGDGSVGAPYASVQRGVNGALPGEKILVAAGSYTAPVDFYYRSGLTLQGADKATVIFQPTTTIPFINTCTITNDRRAALRLAGARNVTVKNVTVDLDIVKGNFIYAIFGCDSTAVVDNSIFKNNVILDTAGGYYEGGLYFRTFSQYDDGHRAAVTISNNQIENLGRVSILLHGYVDATISGNSIYRTVHDFGYGMEIGSQSEATVSDNVIYGFDTKAASDNSTSSGIYIENAFTGPGQSPGQPPMTKNVALINNEIYGCQSGMTVGNQFNNYAGPVGIVVTASGNNIHDNLDYGVLIADEDLSNGSSVTYNGSGNTLANNGELGYMFYTLGDGALIVNLTGETITGHEYGVYLNDYGTATHGVYDITLLENNLAGNDVAVQNDYSGYALSGEYNYYGCAGVPGDAGCSPVVGVDGVPSQGNWPSVSGGNTYYLSGGVDDAADFAGLLADQAKPGDTIYLQAGMHSPAGGYIVDQDGLTIISLPGAEIKPASPCFTVSANDIRLIGGVCTPSTGSPGIVLGGPVSRLAIQNMEIGGGTSNAIELGYDVTDLKIVDNIIHSNTGDGLVYAAGTTVSGVHEVMGNLFMNNGGYGVNNLSSNTYDVTYNSWGHLDGPAAGDGVNGSLTSTPYTHAAPGMISSGTPVANVVGLGYDITYNVFVDANELWGVEFEMSFDPAVVQVVSVTNGGVFAPISEACSLTYNNSTGVIHYCGQSYSSISGASVPAFTVVFHGAGAGVSALHFNPANDLYSMAPPSGASTKVFPAALNDGQVTVMNAFTISGRIDLQGRADDSGTVMTFHPGVLGYGYTSTAANFWGEAGFGAVVADDYPVTAVMPGYLDVTLSSNRVATIGLSRSLSLLVLLGGDANDDNLINITDAQLAGLQYGSSGAGADINGDGVVNMLDLALISVNFLKDSATAYGTWTP